MYQIDHSVGTNRHVGAELGGGVDLGGGINVDGGHNVSGRSLQTRLLGVGLESLLQVEGVGGDGGTGSLDLSPEVLGLVCVESIGGRELDENILLESKVVFITLANKRGVLGLLLSDLLGSSDGVEDGLVKKVDTSIDRSNGLPTQISHWTVATVKPCLCTKQTWKRSGLFSRVWLSPTCRSRPTNASS